MKRLFVILLAMASLSIISCAPGHIAMDTGKYYSAPEYKRWQGAYFDRERHFGEIKQTALNRGYITVDELEEALGAGITKDEDYLPHYKAWDVLVTVVEKELLPFEPMFLLGLEKENYGEAEVIRRYWVHCLMKMKNIQRIEPRPGRAFPTNWPTMKINYQIEKLTSVVGLTDGMLIKLRKASTKAMDEEKWKDAETIQNMIAKRVETLRPKPKTKIIYLGNGSTKVVQVQPSEVHVKVEQIPRYGATDVGRAISLLEGKGGRLTSKQEGALKLLDIFLKR